MEYLISPPEPTDWKISSNDVRDALLRQWPDAQVREETDPQSTVALDWLVDLDGKPLNGSLDRDGQAVSLDADVSASARFALWFRSAMPSTQPLVFYEEGYSADVPLTTDTTEEQLTQPFLAR